MKKWIKLMVLVMSMVIMSLMFVGCTKTEDEGAAVVPQTQSPSDEGDEADAVAGDVESVESTYHPDVQSIVDRGVLKVGVKNDVLGFGFQDMLTGDYAGFEIDIANAIAELLDVEIELTPVTAATRTELLDSGALDFVIATFTITEERKQNWDFSTAYYTDVVTVLVEDASGIVTLEDLLDKKVGVSSGSTSARALVEAMIEKGVIEGEGFTRETFDPSTWSDGVTFLQFDDYPTISIALSASEIDAFCVDKSILNVYNTASRGYIEDNFAPQDYGVATKKGSGLSEFVEALIVGWLNDGTINNYMNANGME